MAHTPLHDTFSVIDDPDREQIRLQPKKRVRRPNWLRLLTLSAFGLAFAAFLNFEGIIAIPGLESFNRDRFRHDPPAVPPVTPRITASPIRPGSPPIMVRNESTTQPVSARPTPSTSTSRPGFGGDPSKRPRSIQEARQGDQDSEPGPARIGRDAAVDLLERKGVVQGDHGFFLNSEAIARTRLNTLNTRAVAFNQANIQLIQARQAVVYLRELNQRIIDVRATISNLDFMMQQYQPNWTRNRWYHGNNNIEHDEYMSLKSQRENAARHLNADLIHERDTLQQQQPNRQLGEATNARRTRAEAAVEALEQLREAVDATKQGYTNLANNPEIKRALATVGQAKLEPSTEFQGVERACRESESSAVQFRLIDGPRP